MKTKLLVTFILTLSLGLILTSNAASLTKRVWQPGLTSTSARLMNHIFDLFTLINPPAAPPRPSHRIITFPPPTATVPSTPTPIPTPPPPPTATVPSIQLMPPPPPTATPGPTATPAPTNTAKPMPVSLPTATPTATATPLPEYDCVVAEFFNSPTTNNFLMVYVAIVDPREIPIGDMKIVGTRLDQPAVYESPLSKWHYEGHSAPGEVIKTGNVKFEPPGGIETTAWVLHLEDSYGHRQSEDIPFDVDGNNKQWYYIKLKRKF